MADSSAVNSSTLGGNILLVDNLSEHLESMTRLLQDNGHTVVGCESRVDALNAFNSSKHEFDIVFTDLHLGELDPRGGVELTKEIRKRREERGYEPSPLILCITGIYKDPRTELEMEREGARFVIKSTDPDFYLLMIQTMLVELEQLRGEGPVFKITHVNSPSPGQKCYPGEEVENISLLHRSNFFPVKLPEAPRHVFDYIARYISRPQTAEQVANGMTFGNAFYHQLLAGKDMSARNVITNVNRIRIEMGNTLAAAGISLDPKEVLTTDQNIDGDEIYKLKAQIRIEHLL
jgi:CheY-like chemotaxis protein